MKPYRRKSLELMTMQLGRQLKAQRMARGISRNDMAKRLGMTSSSLERFENGRRSTSIDKLLRYFSELKVVPVVSFITIDGADMRNKNSTDPFEGKAYSNQKIIEKLNEEYL